MQKFENELDFKEADLVPFVTEKNPIQAVKEWVTSNYKANFPDPRNPEKEKALRYECEREQKRLNALDQELEDTLSHEVVKERDAEGQRNFVDLMFGAIAFAVVIFAIGLMPSIATMMMVDAQKIALIADNPAWGVVFGVTPLAGMMAAIGFRKTIRSSKRRNQFDARLYVAAVTLVFAWAVMLSLAAYPVTLDLEDHSVTIETPTFVIFILTTLVELTGAPALHRIMHTSLAPRHIERVIPRAEFDHKNNNVREEITKAINSATDSLHSYLSGVDRWDHGLAANITKALRLLSIVQRKYETRRTQQANEIFTGLLDETPLQESKPKSNGLTGMFS